MQLTRDPNEVIGDRAAVAAWLAQEKYCARGKSDPVKKDKVYRDAGKGLLDPADIKRITYGEVLAYVASAGLTQRKPGIAESALNALNEQKLQLENRKLEAATELKEMELAVQRRKYVERSVVRRELAGKFGMLEAILKNHGRTYGADLVHEVGGNTAKIERAVALWNEAVDRALDEVGSFKEVDVVIRKVVV